MFSGTAEGGCPYMRKEKYKVLRTCKVRLTHQMAGGDARPTFQKLRLSQGLMGTY
jgi:hypothetical protein